MEDNGRISILKMQASCTRPAECSIKVDEGGEAFVSRPGVYVVLKSAIAEATRVNGEQW